ncbi:MAG: carbamoyltransferase HypF, partial [Rhodothermia bacterium]
MESVRLQTRVRGSVQGVGFRPHVYRVATDLGLSGWVCNTPEGVLIEAEGHEDAVKSFLERLESERPTQARITAIDRKLLDPIGYDGFEIRPSLEGDRRAHILPDIATCPDCLHDLFSAGDRRYRYPFINCTKCGPRFSIIASLPYDRERTTMAGFKMCAECAAEYSDPLDRRFHAQPDACPVCGPRVEFVRDGTPNLQASEAIGAAVDVIRDGEIVAVKGLGGYHLCADACNPVAIDRLRRRKLREEKPLAVMVQSSSVARAFCHVSEKEATTLESSAAPIVLLRMRDGQDIIPSSAIAPGMKEFGVMLPYTPLHHLIMHRFGSPLVATSGNRSNEPICTENTEARRRLEGIADAFLMHDRPIERAVEDSVTRVILNHELLLRRSRGYAPRPVSMPREYAGGTTLAVGAHQKSTVALAIGEDVFISQHLGDLDNVIAGEAFEKAVHDLPHLYDAGPERVVRDMHPDYLSSRWADQSGIPVTAVQHHVAHAFACLAENHVEGPALAVVWDGTGLGTDGSIWGGEFFYVGPDRVERIAHLRPFSLPGGDAAAREPRRSALGVLHEAFGGDVRAVRDVADVGHAGGGGDVRGIDLGNYFDPDELSVMKAMLGQSLNAPTTTSAGRLFDAVACLAGLRTHASFEGQAAMELEHAASSE